MRIPYDSLTLSAVAHEVRGFIGAKVQRISQLDEFSVVLGLYGGPNHGEALFLLSCDPLFARAHFVTKRPVNQPQIPAFCAALRSKLDQSRLRAAGQVGFDRILRLSFEQPGARYALIAELMGKHSNVILVDENDDRIVAVAKPIGPSKSSRVVLIGRRFEPPPLAPRPSLLKANEGDDLAACEGASPFLVALLGAMGAGALRELQERVAASRFDPVISPGNGAYSVSVAPLGLSEFGRRSISVALEQHYDQAIPGYRAEHLKASLLGQLKRVLLSREAASGDLEQAMDAAASASLKQLQGDLILAYGPGLDPGAEKLSTHDYAGNPIEVKLDPELSYQENAQRYFEKARKAKSRAGIVADQLGRMNADRAAVLALIGQVETSEHLTEIELLAAEAKTRRWLHALQSPSTPGKKEKKPYEGHRIRELIGPAGGAVLFGENAESNDYLTLRVAKPDDLWVHVRGAASAHVVIRTDRHPELVGRELLLFAAKIAVANSPSKHSGFVPVDYTLRKYVRKPKGSPPGTALYTHEKTLHVEP